MATSGVSMETGEQYSLLQFMQTVRGSMSQRELAEWLEVSQATVHRLLTDPRTPHETTLKKIAARTGVPLIAIRELARRPGGTDVPFRLPPEADQLTSPQRDLVLRLVSVLLDSSHPAKVTR